MRHRRLCGSVSSSESPSHLFLVKSYLSVDVNLLDLPIPRSKDDGVKHLVGWEAIEQVRGGVDEYRVELLPSLERIHFLVDGAGYLKTANSVR